MYPKKSNEIIRQTAEEMNLSESKVDAVVSFYYKKLRQELSSLSDVKINVPNLGYFQVKPDKIKHTIKVIKEKLEDLKDPTFINHHNKIRLEEKLQTLQNIELKINDYLAERKKVRDEQVKYYMEKQKANNGGN